MNKKHFIFLMVIFCLGILHFIKKSNDHIECTSITTIKYTDEGCKIESTTHVCKEKFNF